MGALKDTWSSFVDYTERPRMVSQYRLGNGQLELWLWRVMGRAGQLYLLVETRWSVLWRR